MSSFFKKKKEEKKESPLPAFEIPRFPEFPSPKMQDIEHPVKHEEIESIKREIEKPPKDLGIPIRKITPQERVMVSRRAVDETKPIFVKIEKYKTALDLIDQIKSKIAEAENILSEMEHLKENEDKELDNWKQQLTKIKENLLSVDKNLFEI